MKRAIVWFKTDLRLHDNETLVYALDHSDEVIPVYCFDEAHFSGTNLGFARMGGFRARFLLEALTDLDVSLRKRGSGLLILRGKPEAALAKLAHERGVHRVFAKREVATEEKQAQERVEQALWKVGCTMDTFSTSTLYHAEDLPFSIRDIPGIFTEFRKKAEKESAIRPVFAAPAVISSPVIPAMKLPTLSDLRIAAAVPDARAAMHFKGGESEGLKRLAYYFGSRLVDTYKETRNGMTGADYSSKFSAWLSIGCLSARRIYHDLKLYEEQHGANDSTYWLIFELIWRDYFRFIMKKHGRKFFLPNGISKKNVPRGKTDAVLLKRWTDGETGMAFVDAHMRELKLTGFMSNRGRQNAASYLINDLGLDWRYGAAYFEQQLIDYDVSSNWGNWAYLAGVGNDPRENRYFDQEKQAKTYDPENVHGTIWLKA